MARRGSRVKIEARKDALDRSLTMAGDIVCVPWTGIDIGGRYICPGFEYKPDRGLIAYVVPLIIMREEGLQPGFYANSLSALSKANPPIDRPMLLDPNRPDFNEVVSPKIGSDEVQGKYMAMLEKYLRVVKIVMPETDYKIHPYPDDYYVVVNGPFDRALFGHLVARPDPSGARFIVAEGQSADSQNKELQASRIQPIPSAPRTPPPAPNAAPATAPRPASVTRAAVATTATQIQQSMPSRTTTGALRRGKMAQKDCIGNT